MKHFRENQRLFTCRFREILCLEMVISETPESLARIRPSTEVSPGMRCLCEEEDVGEAWAGPKLRVDLEVELRKRIAEKKLAEKKKSTGSEDAKGSTVSQNEAQEPVNSGRRHTEGWGPGERRETGGVGERGDSVALERGHPGNVGWDKRYSAVSRKV